MKFQLAATLASAIALAACNPSTPNVAGKGQVTLAFEGAQSARSAALQSDSTRSTGTFMRTDPVSSSLPVTDPAGNQVGSITLSAAWIALSEIGFEHEDEEYFEEEGFEDEDFEDENDDADSEENDSDAYDDEDYSDDEAEFVGPFVLDLLTGTTYPSLPSMEIDTGKYTDIFIGIDMLEEDELEGMPGLPQNMTEKLQTYSLYLEGQYTSLDGVSYVGIPVSVSFDLEGEFELTGTDFTNGFTIDETGVNDIIIAFNMLEWFRFDNSLNNEDSLSFVSEIEDYGNGNSIVLTSYSDSEIMEVIEANIEDSAEYGEDFDDDGELDEDEDDDDDYTDEDWDDFDEDDEE